MQAMVYRGPYKVRVEEKDIPGIEHPNDAIVRVTLAAICGSDLHLYHGMMPDTRVGHTFGHEFIGVVDQVGSSVQNLQGRRPGHGAVQRLLRVLLVLRPRALLQLPQREPERHRGRRHLRLLAHPGGYDGGQASTCGCRSPTSVRRSIPDWMDDEDAVLLHRRAAHRLLRRPARRHRRGRHGRGLRRRAGGPVRREVGMADGRRPGDRDRPPRVPAGEGAHVRPRRDVQLHRVRRHRRAR